MKHLDALFRCILPAVLLLGAQLAFTQTVTTGDVTGVVTDQSGAVVPVAIVTIKYADTNESLSTATSGTGSTVFL